MYVAKKVMILVTLVEIKMQINSADIVLNNLHSKLKDLGGPNKFSMTRDAKFEGAQILDIVL
jgi:hypothetical protein